METISLMITMNIHQRELAILLNALMSQRLDSHLKGGRKDEDHTCTEEMAR